MMEHPSPNAEGFLRDTLVFRIGVLSRVALRAAFDDPTMQAVYAAWLSAPEAPAAESNATSEPDPDVEPAYQTLMEAGIEQGGELVLQARKRAEEFVLTVRHENFSIVACVAFAPRTAHLNGLHVVTFTGKPRAALAWLEQTASQLQRMLGSGERNTRSRRSAAPHGRFN
jgi:hypothetical protein